MTYRAPVCDLRSTTGARLMPHWTRLLKLTTATATRLRAAAAAPGIPGSDRHDLIVAAATLEQLAAVIRREFFQQAA